MRIGRRKRRTDPGPDTAGVGDPADDDLLLATPLDDEDLDSRLELAGRRGLPRSTVVLIAIVFVAVGCTAGIAMGRGAAQLEATIAEQQGAGAPTGTADDGRWPEDPQAQEALAGIRAARADLLAGTVRALDGDTVLLEAPDGTTVRILTAPYTSVETTVEITLGELTPGSHVVVDGETDGVGVVTADTIIRTD